jgi:hypothetical protein
MTLEKTMRYMLLIYGEENALDQDAREACYKESVALTHEIAKRGKFLAAAPLQSISAATSVRVRDGKRMVTDGPFAETREQLGGYYLVDAENLDDAITIAGQIPGAKWGTVEVRPIVELGGIAEV